MKKRKIIALIAITIIALFSCKKNPETLTGSNKIEIKTTTIKDITYNSVVIVSDLVNPVSDAQIIQHGHCWSTEANPSTDEDNTSLGNKINQTSFQSKIENLISKTKYYIRAYVQIEGYIIYGNDVEVTTLDPCDGISSILYGGQIYHTVAIGYQCWLKENLNIGTRIDGSLNQTNNSIIEKYCYDDNESNCDEYGGLYQWDEMMQYTITQAVQGICPNGWHIPTDEEWKILEGSVDSQYGVGDPEWDGTEYRGYDAGKKLKSTTCWYSNGNGTNDYGFTALPCGYRHFDGNFGGIEKFADFWSSTEDHSNYNYAESRSLYYYGDEVYRCTFLKVKGFPVRCLKD